MFEKKVKYINKKNMKSMAKIAKDFSWNIAATVLGTAVLQIMVYPILARWTESDVYGEILTIMGIANILVTSIGGGLNNTRLIQEEKYGDRYVGDFNKLLGYYNIVGTCIFSLLMISMFELTISNLVVISLYVFLGIIRGYGSVAYRLKINYVANFKMNVFLSVGYVVGIILIKITNIWAFPFCLAEFLGICYLYKTSSLHKEGFKKTALWSNTSKILIVLIINTVISNIVTYLDRLVLYPMLGGEQVSIFTVSSFVGKSIGILITPISGVLLSYYAQKNFRMTIRKYWLINLVLITGSTFLGGIALILAPWFTGILYPTLIEASLPYITIANTAALIGVLSNVISPAILKFANINWQLIIQVIYIALYFGLGIVFLNKGGLYGFCIANMLANAVRVCIFLVVGNIGVKKQEEI